MALNLLSTSFLFADMAEDNELKKMIKLEKLYDCFKYWHWATTLRHITNHAQGSIDGYNMLSQLIYRTHDPCGDPFKSYEIDKQKVAQWVSSMVRSRAPEHEKKLMLECCEIDRELGKLVEEYK